jgi:hypothetical protein
MIEDGTWACKQVVERAAGKQASKQPGDDTRLSVTGYEVNRVVS